MTRLAVSPFGVALSIHFVRVLFTQFVFLKRAIRWSEGVTIAVWVFILCLRLTLAAIRNPAHFGIAFILGIAPFLIGSWMNIWSEHDRNVWKKRPENRGRLYAHGRFRFTRRPNYLGDLISLSGLGLIAGRWITAPVLMLCGFVFVNIPSSMLTTPAPLTNTARRTRKHIPFLY